MTVAADVPAQPARETRARRLFRASGVAPLGAFVLLHTLGYAQVLFGKRAFGDADDLGVGTLELTVEVLLVLLPLTFHAAYGGLLFARSRGAADPDRREPLDRLQRFASLVVLIFVVDHFARFRWPILSGQRTEADAHFLLVRELSSTSHGMPLVAAFQLLGIAAVAFHLAYGCYRYDWPGLPWLSRERRRGVVAVVVGLLVLLPGSFAVIALATGKKPPFL